MITMTTMTVMTKRIMASFSSINIKRSAHVPSARPGANARLREPMHHQTT